MTNYIPTTKRKLAQWRGPTSSSDYNELIRTNYADLTRLYNLYHDMEETFGDHFSYTTKENVVLRQRIKALEQAIEDISEGSGTLTARFFSDTSLQNETIEGTITENNRLSIDNSHGIATLPEISSTSKLVTQDSTGLTLIPISLEYAVLASEIPEEGTPLPGNFLRCLNPANNSVWERSRVINGTPTGGFDYSLLVFVRVPTDIVSTLNSNCIIIHTHPSFFTDLLEISYCLEEVPSENLTEVDYATWEQYYVGSEYAHTARWVPPKESGHFILDAGPSRFDFDPMAISAINIKLGQRNYLKEATTSVIPYGMAYLSLETKRYSRQGKKVLKFDAPAGESFTTITNIEGLIYNQPFSAYGNLISTRLFYEPTPDIYEEIGINDYISGGTTTVYVEVTLYETTGNGTPALTGVKITYE